MRRRTKPEGSLTSLLDVLFIIVFASLVQSTARGDERTADEQAPPVPPAPGPVVPAPPAELVSLRQAAVTQTTKRMEGAPLVAVRVGVDGTLVEVEWAGWSGEKRALGLPLLERVPDPDVLVTYLGDRAPALRVCGVVAHELRVADLDGYVVVISPAVALGELPVALVAGLRRDVARCQTEQRAMAVIVEPAMVAPAAHAPAQAPVKGGTP